MRTTPGTTTRASSTVVLVSLLVMSVTALSTLPDAPITTVPSSLCTTLATSLQINATEAAAAVTLFGIASSVINSNGAVTWATSTALGSSVGAYRVQDVAALSRLLERAVAVDSARAISASSASVTSFASLSAITTALTMQLTVCLNYTTTPSTQASDTTRLQQAIAFANTTPYFGTMPSTVAWANAALLGTTTLADGSPTSGVAVSVTSATSPSAAWTVTRTIYLLDGHDGAGPAWDFNDAAAIQLSIAGELKALAAFSAAASVVVVSTASVTADGIPTSVGAVLAARCVVAVAITATTKQVLSSVVSSIAGVRFALPQSSVAMAAQKGLSSRTTPLIAYVPATVSEPGGSTALSTGNSGPGDCTALSCLVPVLLWSFFVGVVLVCLCVMSTGRALDNEELEAHRMVKESPPVVPASRSHQQQQQRRYDAPPHRRREAPHVVTDYAVAGDEASPARRRFAAAPPQHQAARRSATSSPAGFRVQRQAVSAVATSRHRSSSGGRRHGADERHHASTRARPQQPTHSDAQQLPRSPAKAPPSANTLDGIGTLASSGTFEHVSDEASLGRTTTAAAPAVAAPAPTTPATRTPASATVRGTGAGAQRSSFEI